MLFNWILLEQAMHRLMGLRCLRAERPSSLSPSSIPALDWRLRIWPCNWCWVALWEDHCRVPVFLRVLKSAAEVVVSCAAKHHCAYTQPDPIMAFVSEVAADATTPLSADWKQVLLDEAVRWCDKPTQLHEISAFFSQEEQSTMDPDSQACFKYNCNAQLGMCIAVMKGETAFGTSGTSILVILFVPMERIHLVNAFLVALSTRFL